MNRAERQEPSRTLQRAKAVTYNVGFHTLKCVCTRREFPPQRQRIVKRPLARQARPKCHDGFDDHAEAVATYERRAPSGARVFRTDAVTAFQSLIALST
jgi:hypothetical protein